MELPYGRALALPTLRPYGVLVGWPGGVDLVAKDGRLRRMRGTSSSVSRTLTSTIRDAIEGEPFAVTSFACFSRLFDMPVPAFRSRSAGALREVQARARSRLGKLPPNRTVARSSTLRSADACDRITSVEPAAAGQSDPQPLRRPADGEAGNQESPAHDLTATAGLTAGHANSRGRFSACVLVTEDAAMAAGPGLLPAGPDVELRPNFSSKEEGRGVPDDGFVDELRSTLDEGCGAVRRSEIDARSQSRSGGPCGAEDPRAVRAPEDDCGRCTRAAAAPVHRRRACR